MNTFTLGACFQHELHTGPHLLPDYNCPWASECAHVHDKLNVNNQFEQTNYSYRTCFFFSFFFDLEIAAINLLNV